MLSNEQGFDSLGPDYRGGRPKKATPAERDRIVAVARARPDHQGVALTRWSLAKLSGHLAGMGVDLCEEALGQVLRGAGLSHQRTRSWKWIPDPLFTERAERVLSLYREPPADGPVVCFGQDEGEEECAGHLGTATTRDRRSSGVQQSRMSRYTTRWPTTGTSGDSRVSSPGGMSSVRCSCSTTTTRNGSEDRLAGSFRRPLHWR